MKTHRIGVRVSGELYALLAVAGDVSAATRALAILGAAAAGYELGSLRDEAGALLASPLDPPLRAALRELVGGRSTLVPQMLDKCSTFVEPMLNTTPAPRAADPLTDELLLSTPSLPPDADPLANIGFEV